MPKRRIIIPPGMEALWKLHRYAPGVLVDDTLYIAGMVGRRANMSVVEEPRAQYVQALENVGLVLAAAGAGFTDIVEMETWFLDFPGALAVFREVKDEYFKAPPYPTWTGFGVAAFSTPGIVCEIKCTAVLNLTDG
ncbi:RidA family protein [Elioraea sp.]|uniref:RidA family protein n=1 Tax=Elioraea sp. TaxID=2185103 RepID=UPI0025C5D657|nr:RidA family protein [Elioraea sp.]